MVNYESLIVNLLFEKKSTAFLQKTVHNNQMNQIIGVLFINLNLLFAVQYHNAMLSQSR